jgi:hypothetical protein
VDLQVKREHKPYIGGTNTPARIIVKVFIETNQLCTPNLTIIIIAWVYNIRMNNIVSFILYCNKQSVIH